MENVIFIKIQQAGDGKVWNLFVKGWRHPLNEIFPKHFKGQKQWKNKHLPAFCPLSWNSEKTWLSHNLESKWVICLTSPSEEEIFERPSAWFYKVLLSGSSLPVGLCMRNFGLHVLTHCKKPTQSKITSADKRQQKIRECFSLI